MKNLRSLGRTLEKSLALRGVMGTLLFALTLTGRSVRKLIPGVTHDPAATGQRDDEFDRKHHVDTAGVIPLSHLNVTGQNWIFGSQYQAVSGDADFTNILQGLSIAYDDFAFIDLGSGKGRAVLLASRVPFKKIIGVEFSQELHRIAQDNLRRWPAENRQCNEIELLCMDAADYRFPADPLILYMYNPFSRPVMQRVVQNVAATFAEQPRRIIVVYFTPKVGDLWENSGFLKRVQQGPGYVIFDIATQERPQKEHQEERGAQLPLTRNATVGSS